MSATFVQKVADYANTTGSPLTFGPTFGVAPVTTGNTLIVIGQMSTAVGCAYLPDALTVGLTDSAGNHYQLACVGWGRVPYGNPCNNGIPNHAGGATFAWVAFNVTGGNLTWSMSSSVAGGSAGGLGPNYDLCALVVEYSGIPNLGIDSAVATGSNAWGINPVPTGYIRTTSTDTLVLAFAGMRAGAGGVPSFPSGWDLVAAANHDIGADEFASIGLAGGPATHIGTFGTSVTMAGGLFAPTSAGVLAIRLTPAPSSIFLGFDVQPGFFDIQDSVLACGNPLADYDLIKIKYNADLAAVRPEAFFSGYFTDQDTLPLPVSAVDAYTYSLTESLYYFQLASTKGPQPGFTPGQELFPPPDFSGHPIDGFLVNPYQLEPNFGTLTQAGFSTEKQITLRSLFYEHGDVQTSSPEESYSAGISAAFCFGQRRSATLDPILPGPVYQTTSTPTFTDFPDSAIVDGAPITDTMMQAISRNAKLGVFRFEIFFMGYYRNGDVVPTPIGAGNYAYSYPECIFMPLLGSSRQPTGDFVPGQVYFPQLANLDVYQYPASSFPEQLLISSTGQVTCTINGANGVQGQGSVAVYCFAQRYPSLTMASQPFYTTISDEDLVGGQVPSAELLQDLNNNAKFGIVAKEAFWMGYFADGNQLNPPTSPVDGYTYQHYEMLYMPIWVSSNQPTALTPGQTTWPTTNNPWSTTTTHDGNTIPFIVAAPYKCFVNQYVTPFGQLTSKGFDGNNGAISTGVVSVYAIGCRQCNPTGTTL